MDADIRKGAFRVNRLADLASILDASKAVEGRHVLLGMGALGAVTRIRTDVLGNEDWILLADMLEYDFQPLCEEWREICRTLHAELAEAAK